jgi:hypothetical protein
MGIFQKNTDAVVTQANGEQHRLTSKLPKPTATEQKAIDGSVGRGLNGTNRRQN